MKTYKERPIYIEKLKPFINKDVIKVLIGQRRVGKSYILLELIDYIKQHFKAKQAQIIYINKELFEFDSITDYQKLIEYVNNKIKTKEKYYLFIDEIQDIENFEKALRHFQAQNNFDVYCTGSNAKLLSSELATYISGRYIEFEVYPLSYAEFLLFHNLGNSQEAFHKYLKWGGLPYLINLQLNDEVVYQYLKSVYNSIILKDIVARYAVRNVNLLDRLIIYVANNIGNIISAHKIGGFLNTQRLKISPSVVLNYLSYLNAVFFLNKIQRIDLQGKKIFEIGEKYYFTDLGIRHSLIGFKQRDIGKILENIVFLHLKICGYRIFVGQDYPREIDFVCEKNQKKVYIQVAYLLTEDKTKAREFGNLLQIKDNYEKIVVSADELPPSNNQGIQHFNIRDFLLNFT
ncbi:ATP-binding protein [bacterium]|jgi:uncharacterized protein|nr:ATP-binding protein [bacterium]MBT3580914.1 ATP-binding protein [bacterium]MBT4552028.1 ATP-binding protein [bacterium]MBT5988985.1 ATP-binding protein [bacterium]MBT7088403.1 ATP-binding protein [bacterium]